MRHRLPFMRLLLLAGLALLAGCNLNARGESPAPRIITATPDVVRRAAPIRPTLAAATATAEPSATATTDTMALAQLATATAATTTPSPTVSPTVAASPTATVTLTPTPPVTPLPTRPPTVAALDDGSGNVIVGTGGSAGAGVAGVDTLPETLYYLAPDSAGVMQVWRLPYGLALPQQLTYSASGVSAFDPAPNGTLAYISGSGEMIIGGIPFAPPANDDGTRPQVTALAWSPAGDWLAYTLQTPGAEEAAAGVHPIDGLWMRNNDGVTTHLAPNVYASGATRRIFSGPLDWHPGGGEILVPHVQGSQYAYSRINITTAAVTLVATLGPLPPIPAAGAVWSINGNAIIISVGDAVLTVDAGAESAAAQPLVAPPAAVTQVSGAQQFGNGAVTFLGLDATGYRLYLVPPDQSAAQAVTDDLAPPESKVSFLWDNFGEQTLLVVTPRDARMGTAYLRTSDNTLHDLTPLLGPVAEPQWGPLFKIGDSAIVRTTSGDFLNLRAEASANGQLLFQLTSGARVTVIGGPHTADGYRWWKIQTSDGISGWAVESVTEARGVRLRTLVPAG